MSEHPVDGMRGGNLSGLALCGKELWTVSDRDDDQIYRLDTGAPTWNAEAVQIDVPPVPESGLPWGCVRAPRLLRSFAAVTWILKASAVMPWVIATLSAKPMRRCCRSRRLAHPNG